MNKKYLLYSVLSGLLLGFSWPVNGFVIFIFIAFVPLLYLEELLRNKSLKKLFSYSFITFFIWNTIATWWLIHSTLFGMTFAILVNSLLMSLVFTSYSLVSRKVHKKLGLAYFISIWIVFEKFHLLWDFSWPWLNLGNVFSESHYLIQWYEFTGSFGGTLWVLIVNLMFLKAFKFWIINKKININSIAISLLFISIPIIASFLVYSTISNEKKHIDISIIQPNIDPYTEKYGRTNLSILKDFENMINNNGSTGNLIIAPETYFSESPGFQIDQFKNSTFYLILNDYLKNKNEAQLLSGIQFYKIYNSYKSKSKTSNYVKDSIWVDLYNSSFLSSNLSEPQIYHKSKLVVGVENMPYKEFLEPILGNALLNLGGSVMSRGIQENRIAHTLNNGIKVAPVICYESVYGEYVTEYVRNGAQMLAIITNDGWWKESQGFQQHLSYAKIRAIETRRSIARSANTGVSAIINKKGEIIQQLNYNTSGIINSKIGISNNITFYVKYGDFIYRFALFFSIIILLFSFAKKKKY